MKNVIIGTAGHVDHGKTQLIKALSGIDTDRLSEEKKRGITIELGFAHIPNDEGYNIGVIDVPGHEKFIKNMLAGIGGVDFVLFVVAADEGIMPQTKEHFEILQTLGIDDGIVAITKKDMVEEEWLEMVQDELVEYFKGSFLEGKPMISVSSKTGENIDVLKDAIVEKCDRKSKRREEPELFRLPVDRVFSVKGFGTVATGTLMDGMLNINDDVVIFPEEKPAKVRGIQTYGKDAERAVAGQRTAVNLSGLKKEDLDRGSVLAMPNAVVVTNMLDVELKIFESSDRQVLNNSRVHLYVGSKEVLCKVILMDKDVVSSGDTAFAQLRLEEPIAIRRGDRFIIRFYSPVITIGGGRVLDTTPDKHKRNRENVIDDFKIMASGDIVEIAHSKISKWKYYNTEILDRELGITKEEATKVVASLKENDRLVILDDGTLLSDTKVIHQKDRVLGIIGEYHKQNPMVDGIPKRELISRIKELEHLEDEKLLQAIIDFFLSKGMLEDKGKSISAAGFKIEFTAGQLELLENIAQKYKTAGFELIKNDEIIELVGDKSVAAALILELVNKGEIIKVDASYYIDSESWQRAIEAVKELCNNEEGCFTLAEFRDYFDISRKYASLILPALDKTGVTVFNGRNRKVIK